MGRIWRVLGSPGVVWWGIPAALLSTYLRVRRETGWSWEVVGTGRFWANLAVTLLITGVLGGLAFGWAMGRAGFRLRRPFARGDHDRTA